MQLKFTKIAQAEIEDAKEYYNLQQYNLGIRFKQDVIIILTVAHQHRKPIY